MGKGRVRRDVRVDRRREKSLSFHQADHEADHGHDGKDEKEDLGNFDGAGGNASETEHGCNQCDHEENNGIVQHVDLLAGRCPWVAAVFGFGGIAAGAVEIAKILFFIFAIFAVVSFVIGLMKRN